MRKKEADASDSTLSCCHGFYKHKWGLFETGSHVAQADPQLLQLRIDLELLVALSPSPKGWLTGVRYYTPFM